jgi:ribosome recycling factor
MIQDVLNDFREECGKAKEALEKEYSRVRTGRASPSLLDNVKVEYYGMPTPLKQVATVAVGDSRLLTVSPWDKGQLTEIERAIQSSGLGVTPSNDGKIIRIPIPPLTGERRKELVRQVKKLGEDYKVTIRNHRRDANDMLKSGKDDKELTEDEYHRGLKRIQDETDASIKALDAVIAAKEEEIMEF